MSDPTSAQEEAAADAMLDAQIDEYLDNERLKTKNAELRELLSDEWFANHDEHCGEWPHPGKECYYPMPEILRRKL